MSESLSPECTPLKHAYDSCFNVWFEGYLEAALANASDAQRKVHYKQKAEEFDAKCGTIYKDYQNCLQNAVKKRGIEPLLQQAREEHPLTESLAPVASKDSK
ncbi:hypothetical protein MKEN_01423100 [Mycena kentingensis (nom. inval.)]|nr:hypothetical protein MKEN_01423100 [Mycena kentingensis (nom. inval.)]